MSESDPAKPYSREELRIVALGCLPRGSFHARSPDELVAIIRRLLATIEYDYVERVLLDEEDDGLR